MDLRWPMVPGPRLHHMDLRWPMEARLLAGSSLGVMHKADAKTHQNGGHNAAAGNCAKCWTFDTAIRHHHYNQCPHRNKPKLTDTQKKQARAAMKKEEEDDY